jgi:hypothetical protein
MAKKKRRLKTENVRRNKQTTDDVVKISDARSAFSWSIFWDEVVLERIKQIQEYLKRRGFYAFMTADSQYRNRLILKLFVLFLGFMIGVVPRINDMKAKVMVQTSQSEIKQIQNKVYTYAPITIKPMASSHYNGKHVIVFDVQGSTEDGVSSSVDDYVVKLSAFSGVKDSERVTYKHTVVPISANERLVVLYIDTSKQTVVSGHYNVFINQPDVVDNKDAQDNFNIMISLSNAQETNELYNASGLSLEALSGKLLESASVDDAGIDKAQKELDKALNVYSNTIKRLEVQGGKVEPSVDSVKEYVRSHSYFSYLTDRSGVADIRDEDDDASDMDFSNGSSSSDAVVALEMNGKRYVSGETDEKLANDPYYDELNNLQTAYSSVLSNLTALNSVRQQRYQQLSKLAYVLRSNVAIDDFKDDGHVKVNSSLDDK